MPPAGIPGRPQRDRHVRSHNRTCATLSPAGAHKALQAPRRSFPLLQARVAGADGNVLHAYYRNRLRTAPASVSKATAARRARAGKPCAAALTGAFAAISGRQAGGSPVFPASLILSSEPPAFSRGACRLSAIATPAGVKRPRGQGTLLVCRSHMARDCPGLGCSNRQARPRAGVGHKIRRTQSEERAPPAGSRCCRSLFRLPPSGFRKKTACPRCRRKKARGCARDRAYGENAARDRLWRGRCARHRRTRARWPA